MLLNEIKFELKMIMLDADGVVAHFAAGARSIFPEFVERQTESNRKQDSKMWSAIRNYQKRGGRFWYELPLMPDAMELFNYVKQYPVEILTACGDPSFGAGDQKIDWFKEHFGNVKVNLVRRSSDKAQFAESNIILIDDKMKSIQPFVDAGGKGILHKSAKNTIEILKSEYGL